MAAVCDVPLRPIALRCVLVASPLAPHTQSYEVGDMILSTVLSL